MHTPLPTNIELLIYIANQAGYSYDDAYAIWRWYHRHPDSHLIVETVFHIARTQRLPIMLARMRFEGIMSN